MLLYEVLFRESYVSVAPTDFSKAEFTLIRPGVICEQPRPLRVLLLSLVRPDLTSMALWHY